MALAIVVALCGGARAPRATLEIRVVRCLTDQRLRDGRGGETSNDDGRSRDARDDARRREIERVAHNVLLQRAPVRERRDGADLGAAKV